ncbi:protein of unknown function [Pseudomonas sp. JV551A1]|uniref:Uncharacterized protein n=1 Tax=Pseudomonas inefficax TaxID=2078786 RepID=A0AAQ1P905_9PSED|nr:protein of unknown function [Pseudomonas sp. JV551A1]SPO59990.1 protein of unknown function [Pseudomonas inefficax]
MPLCGAAQGRQGAVTWGRFAALSRRKAAPTLIGVRRTFVGAALCRDGLQSSPEGSY